MAGYGKFEEPPEVREKTRKQTGKRKYCRASMSEKGGAIASWGGGHKRRGEGHRRAVGRGGGQDLFTLREGKRGGGGEFQSLHLDFLRQDLGKGKNFVKFGVIDLVGNVTWFHLRRRGRNNRTFQAIFVMKKAGAAGKKVAPPLEIFAEGSKPRKKGDAAKVDLLVKSRAGSRNSRGAGWSLMSEGDYKG